jgi:hypothetical protein
LIVLFTFTDIKITKNDFVVNKRYNIVYVISNICIFITCLLCIYGILQLITMIRMHGYLTSYFLLRKEGSNLLEQLKLKQLSYMIMPLVLYSYMNTKRKSIFTYIRGILR